MSLTTFLLESVEGRDVEVNAFGRGFLIFAWEGQEFLLSLKPMRSLAAYADELATDDDDRPVGNEVPIVPGGPPLRLACLEDRGPSPLERYRAERGD